ncbi:MAG: arsenic transporter [Actinobacteria bacterium]|nr:arsenic transporter [Actinomycetota bacterium]
MPASEFVALAVLVLALVGVLWRPFGTRDWMWTCGAALIVLLSGLLSLADAGSTLAAVTPVLAFLVGVSVVAELSSHAGVFERAAFVLARWSRGHNLRLFLWVFALAAFATSIFSLDGAVVVMTPVVVHLARMPGVRLLPLAFTVIYVANCGSLLFPVSNLTNLLAVELTGMSFFEYTARMWLAAVLVLAVTGLLLWIRFRSGLATSFTAVQPPPASDVVLLRLAGIICIIMLPGFFVAGLLGVGVEWIALGAALVLAVAFLARGSSGWNIVRTVPWQVLFFVIGLFLIVAAARDSGLGTQVGRLMTLLAGDELAPLLGSAGLATLAANLLNNLPAFLILAPDAIGAQLGAVLVGVNAGPMLTPIGSLATVLWLHLIRRHQAQPPRTATFVWFGLLATPPIVLVGTIGVWLTG